MDVAEICIRLRALEQIAGDNADKLAEVEQVYEAGAKTLSGSIQFLRQRNQFRIRHIRAMRIRRPRMLFEGRTFYQLNFQSAPALKNADTVILSFENSPAPKLDGDVLHIHPLNSDTQDLVQALPDGFMPDFYFNYQVCTSRHFFHGWEAAPFPTVANLCHMFMARSCYEISQLFDFVLPISPVLAGHLRKSVNPEKIIEIPFGLGWGHFNQSISPGADDQRDIDVLLSFPADPDSGLYGNTRMRVHQLFREAEANAGSRYRFVYPGTVDKKTYIALLKRSRIVLNASGIHGPYNYRTNEAIAAGALLMQLEPDFITGPQHMEQFLKPDEEYVPFRAGDFLPKLMALLENEPQRAEIARRGMQRMMTDFTYDRLYAQLFAALRPHLESGDWKNRRISPQRALLARTGHQLQLLHVRRMSNVGEIYIPQKDFAEICSGKIGAPQAVLMALFRRLPPGNRQFIMDTAFPGTHIDNCSPAGRLQFYEAMYANLRHPSPVDMYNYALLCTMDGNTDKHKVLTALRALDVPDLKLSQEDMLRVITLPDLPGQEEESMRSDRIRIYNLPTLLTGDRTVWQKAAIDYMRLNLYAVMKMTDSGNSEVWQEKMDALRAAYPMEGHEPDYLSIPAYKAAAE